MKREKLFETETKKRAVFISRVAEGEVRAAVLRSSYNLETFLTKMSELTELVPPPKRVACVEALGAASETAVSSRLESFLRMSSEELVIEKVTADSIDFGTACPFVALIIAQLLPVPLLERCRKWATSSGAVFMIATTVGTEGHCFIDASRSSPEESGAKASIFEEKNGDLPEIQCFHALACISRGGSESATEKKTEDVDDRTRFMRFFSEESRVRNKELFDDYWALRERSIDFFIDWLASRVASTTRHCLAASRGEHGLLS